MLDPGLEGEASTSTLVSGPSMPSIYEVFEATTDCVALLDHDWIFTFLNSAGRECLGKERELVGVPLQSLFEEERGSVPWRLTAKAAAERQPSHFEFFGSQLGKWFEVHVHPIESGLQIFFRDITSRKSSELALQESEERLRLSLEAAGDGAWDWDLVTGNFSLATGLVETMGYGAAPLRVLQGDFLKIVHREDAPALQAALAAHLKGEAESYSCEFRTRAVDGSWRWVLIRGRVVARDPETGRARRMLGISSDITRRKLAEAKVLEHANLLALAKEGAGAGSWSVDLETLIINVSPQGLELLGLPEEHDGKIDYRAWRGILHSGDRRAASAAFRDAIQKGKDYSTEFRVRRGDGCWRWIHSLGRLIHDGSGSRPRFVGLILDVTERKVAAELLKLSEQRLRLALEAAGDGAWEWTVASDAVNRSPKLIERLGYKPEDFSPSASFLTSLMHPDDIPRVAAAEQDHFLGRSDTFVAEYRLRGANGDWYWVLDRGRVVEWDAVTNEPTRMVGTTSDITGRKHAELELHRLQGELIHLSRLSAMGTMASTLAHELNQPLTAAANFARGIRHSLGQAERGDLLAEALDGLEASAERAGEIVRRLRDYVKRGELDRREVSIGQIVKEACDLALLDARSVGLEYQINLDQRFDAILADKVQIQQVLLNIIRNSVEAMIDAGPVRHLLIVSKRLRDGRLRVSVSDTGPGIAPEMLPDLFTPFVSSKGGGLGVGLSICRTIIESHEGRIWAEPRDAGGNIMHFTVPLA